MSQTGKPLSAEVEQTEPPAGSKMSATGPVQEESQVARFIATLRDHLPELRETYLVRSLGIFGSHVYNRQRRGSDLDVLVEFVEPPSLLKFIRLEHQLSDILGVKVDLVMKDSLKPAIGKHILAEVIPV